MPDSLNILLCGISEDDTGPIERTLRAYWPNLVLERMVTGPDFRRALKSGTWQAVLADEGKSGFTTTRAIEVLRESDQVIPFIVISDGVETDHAVTLIHAGVSDYVCKDDLPRLVPTLARVLRDADERRAFRYSEERLRIIAENAPVGIAIIGGEDGIVQYANAKWDDMFGHTPGKSAGRSVVESYGDLDKRPELREEVRRRGVVINRETLLRREDGSTFWGLLSIRTLSFGPREAFLAIATDIDERKRTEKALLESEERFRAAFEDTAVGAAIVDGDGRYHEVNDALCDMLGYSRVELLRMGFQDVTHSDDRAAAEARHAASFAGTKMVYPVEKRYLRKDGGIVWGLVSTSMLRSKEEALREKITQIQDITQRKAAEEELRHTLRARKVISGGNQAMLRARSEQDVLDKVCEVIVEEGGYPLAWVGYAENDEAKTIRPVSHRGVDYGFLESLGMTWSDGESGRTPAGQAIRTGKPVHCGDVTSKAYAAEWREAVVRRGFRSKLALPLKDETGTFGSLNIYSEDVDAFLGEETDILTEAAKDLAYGIQALRNERRRQTVESEMRKLQRAVEQSAHSVVITDRNGIIEYVNPMFSTITGYAAEEAIGQNPRILQSGETLAEEYERLWATITSGNEWRGTIRNKRKDGSFYWDQTVISPVRDESGRIVNFVGVQEDITQRRESEKRLRQSEKIEALGNLASGIAHDFNNMLLPILTMTEMVHRSLPADDEKNRVRLDHVTEAAQRAADLVKRILTFSRTEETQIGVPIDFSAVVGESVELLRSTIPSTITIGVELDPAAGKVVAGADQVQSIVLNLAKNAADAMEGITGRLDIEVSRVVAETQITSTLDPLQPGEYVRLSVADSGPGIESEILSRIFEPYFTTKSVGKGTGLGLAMVHGIVTKAGGNIAVESAPGYGTRFTLYFPAAPVGPRSSGAPPPEEVR